jgi:hypothetical protein
VRLNFSQWTHLIHPIGPQTHVSVLDRFVTTRTSVQIGSNWVPNAQVRAMSCTRNFPQWMHQTHSNWPPNSCFGAFRTVPLQDELWSKTSKTHVRSKMSRQIFPKKTHQVHPVGHQTQVFGHFGPFRYCTNFSKKLAKVVSLMHEIVQQSRVGICHNKRTRSTPLKPILMFWGVLDRSITSWTSVQTGAKLVPLMDNFVQRSRVRIFRNKCT